MKAEMEVGGNKCGKVSRRGMKAERVRQEREGTKEDERDGGGVERK